MNDVVLAIKSLMETALTTTYKKYYYGEDKVGAQQKFPTLEVIPNSSNITNIGTGGLKDNDFSITINIKNSLKNKITSSTDKEIITHIQDIVKKMEERNSDSTFKSTTILGVLQDNLELSNTVHINGDWEISYDNFELAGSWIYMGSVTFTGKLLTPN